MFGLRYIMQAMTMLGDLMLIGASAFALCFYWNVFPVNILAIYLIFKCFNAWQEQGAFMAWSPKNIKQFLATAKRLGV